MNIIIKKILLVFFSCIFALSNANSIETKAISAHVEDITTNTVLFEKKVMSHMAQPPCLNY